MGLLRPSFVPPPEIRALRDLTRARLQLVRDRTREWQRLEKLLEGALLKLSSAVHSLAATKTARVILDDAARRSWLFREFCGLVTLGGACRLRSRLKLARPYIWRFTVLLTVPSTLPEL
jgi:hypothetical protein